MGTFAEFIESDAFFPVLILLLLILMFTFVSILMSGKNKAKREMQERKKIQIDENAQVQLVQHGVITDFKTEAVNDDEEEIGSNEVGLVKEVEAVDLSEVEEFIDNERVTIEKNPDTEIEVPELTRSIEDMTDEYLVAHEEAKFDEPNESDIVKVEVSTPTALTSDIGEEVTIPQAAITDESKEVPAVSYENTEIKQESDAFKMNANENHSINDHIEYETPKEYDGDKTEILEFPDFDFFDDDSTQKIETQIINQANKYIETVMESRESHEK